VFNVASDDDDDSVQNEPKGKVSAPGKKAPFHDEFEDDSDESNGPTAEELLRQ